MSGRIDSRISKFGHLGDIKMPGAGMGHEKVNYCNDIGESEADSLDWQWLAG